MAKRKLTQEELAIALGKLIVVLFVVGLFLFGVEGAITLTVVFSILGYFWYRNAEIDDDPAEDEGEGEERVKKPPRNRQQFMIGRGSSNNVPKHHRKNPPVRVIIITISMIITFIVRGLMFVNNPNENIVMVNRSIGISIGIGFLIAVYGLWTIQTWGVPLAQTLYVLDYITFVL